jgi:hypothetical protein
MQAFFPFHTCETPNNDGLVAQPVSATINIITCIILIYFAWHARTITIKILLLSFIVFQAFHAFSHIRHIEGHVQSNVIHTIWYFVAFMVLFTSMQMSKKPPSIYTILLLSIIILIDLYLFFYTSKVYMVFTAFTLPVIVVLSYYNTYPTFMKNTIPYLILLLIIVAVLLLNEKYNCEAMIAYANLPYHAIIETLGLILFTTLAYLFVRWEQTIY